MNVIETGLTGFIVFYSFTVFVTTVPSAAQRFAFDKFFRGPYSGINGVATYPASRRANCAENIQFRFSSQQYVFCRADNFDDVDTLLAVSKSMVKGNWRLICT